MSYTPSVAETTLAGTRSTSPSGEKTFDSVALAQKLSKVPENSASEPDLEKVAVESVPTSSAKPRSIHGFKWVLVCSSLYITAFLYGLDTTIAADVQVAVVATFGNVEQLTWLGTGFPLGSIATVLPM